jgi:transcriptional regulator with XRE-family HTH domain
VSTPASNEPRVIPLRPRTSPSDLGAAPRAPQSPAPQPAAPQPAAPRAPRWRALVGAALRRERLAQERTLKEVAEAARISMPYLSELERGRKEASSEVLAAAARALGLGLGDLLSLAQHQLARRRPAQSQLARQQLAEAQPARTARVSRGRTSPTARHDGLCLAA